ERVPLLLFERLACRFVVLEVVEPAATPFVVDTARVRPVGRVNFDLVPKYSPASAPLDLLSGRFHFLPLFSHVASDLHAGVEPRSDLELQLQHKVAVLALRTEE